MEGFHRRYMSAHRVCRYWVNMNRALQVDAIIPRHGRGVIGRRVVNECLDWLERLTCRIASATQDLYPVPRIRDA